MNPYIDQRFFEKLEISDTQKTIQNEFLKLYRKKDYDRISVKELCVAVPVARTTFYSYYQNIDELLEEIENQQTQNLIFLNMGFMDRNEADDNNMEIFIGTLDYIMQRKELYEALLVKQPDYRFIQKWKGAIKYHFWNRYFREKPNISYELTLEVIASAVISAYTYWLTHPQNVNVSQFNQMVIDMLKAIDYTL